MNELKHKVKAVIFDMDGTIVKTEHIWGKVVIDVLAECGIRTLNDEQKSQLQSLSGVGMEYSCRFVKEKFGLKQSSQELLDRKVALAHLSKVLSCSIQSSSWSTFRQALQQMQTN